MNYEASTLSQFATLSVQYRRLGLLSRASRGISYKFQCTNGTIGMPVQQVSLMHRISPRIRKSALRYVRSREELGVDLAIRHWRERLRRPAADIGSLARGNPYMASRRIASTTKQQASALG